MSLDELKAFMAFVILTLFLGPVVMNILMRIFTVASTIVVAFFTVILCVVFLVWLLVVLFGA